MSKWAYRIGIIVAVATGTLSAADSSMTAACAEAKQKAKNAGRAYINLHTEPDARRVSVSECRCGTTNGVFGLSFLCEADWTVEVSG